MFHEITLGETDENLIFVGPKAVFNPTRVRGGGEGGERGDKFERQLVKLKCYSILFLDLLSFSIFSYVIWLLENERFNS